MDVRFTLDEGIVFIHYNDVLIDSDAAFEQWRDEVLEGMERMFVKVGAKYPLAVCIDGLTLQRAYGDRYSREITRIAAQRYAVAVTRFGASGRTTAVIAVEALRRVEGGMAFASQQSYSANVFSTRKEAVRFLRALGH